MPLKRRGKWYHISEMVNGVLVRESLGTKDHRLAKQHYKDRIGELVRSTPDPSLMARGYAKMSVSEAAQAYARERGPSVSPRTVEQWEVCARPLAAYFQDLCLKRFSAAGIAAYQSHRLSQSIAPKSINNEVAFLRQLLKRAKLWHRFCDEVHRVPGGRKRPGRALTEEEQARLFAVARLRPEWIWAYTALVLAYCMGMRPVEIRNLRWRDIDWERRLLTVTVSKTPEGWRTLSLGLTCLNELQGLYERARDFGGAEPDHFVFPHHIGFRNRFAKAGIPSGRILDPTQPMTSWKKAFREIATAAGLADIRFYDARHTVITTLQEKGVPDWVIQAQVGHVSPEESKPYSHIRRKALDQIALLLEPTWIRADVSVDRRQIPGVGAQTTTQSGNYRSQVIDSKEGERVGATGLEPVTPAV